MPIFFSAGFKKKMFVERILMLERLPGLQEVPLGAPIRK
jgi:hypothetical protein